VQLCHPRCGEKNYIQREAKLEQKLFIQRFRVKESVENIVTDLDNIYLSIGQSTQQILQ
jgi:hypothetical protein